MGGSIKPLMGRDRKILLPANVIYTQVFEPIPGCGPLIAARFISAIGDIRRFPSVAQLTAFAGYHHFTDGSRARRVRGQVSNWNPTLKQAVFLLCDQTLKRKDSPWRHRLNLRRAYELYKILRDRQKEANTQRLDVEILPAAFRDRVIMSVNDMTLADLTVLAAHVDDLRKRAGVMSSTDEDADGEAQTTVNNPALAKLVRGVKMLALQKAMRWLGQQFLKHIFAQWRQALGLPELSPRTKKAEPSSASSGPVQYASV